MDNEVLVLREEEWKAGWHWCDEFDGLLVGPGMVELKHCRCEVADPEAAEALTALQNQARYMGQTGML